MKNITKFAAVGVVTMASLAPLSADALNLTFKGPTATSTNFPQVNTSLVGDVNAGPFNMSGDEISDFVAWCFELDKDLETGTGTYTIGTFLSSDASGRVQSVFDANYDESAFVTDRTKGAAFQLAIWEAIYETTETDLSLASGAFHSSTTSTEANSLRALADGFLTAANDYDGSQKWVITEYGIDGNQNLGSVNAIPLPAAAWLLMFASGGLLAAKRRQAKKAA